MNKEEKKKRGRNEYKSERESGGVEHRLSEGLSDEARRSDCAGGHISSAADAAGGVIVGVSGGVICVR